MTVNEKLGICGALDQLVESAALCVRDADAFLLANRDIEALIAERWQTISSELAKQARHRKRWPWCRKSPLVSPEDPGPCQTCLGR